MGLFNRGFKPDLSTDGSRRRRTAHAEPEHGRHAGPTLAEEHGRGSRPPDEPDGVRRRAEPRRTSPTPTTAEPAESRARRSREAVPRRAAGRRAASSREPEPRPSRGRASAPPVNPAPPDPRTRTGSAPHEALAPPRARPASRPPGAAIGDESERRAKIISFANQKGGVAKTTTTLNLAVAFAESGHDVLAVDLDPQGNLTMSQGIDPDKVEGSMYDVLVDHMPIREVIARARDRHRRGLDRPRRSRDRDEHADRPRALAGEGAVGGRRRLRLRLHRHAAEPGAADRQRPDRVRQGDRPRPVRISLDAGARPAPEHAAR